MSDVSSWSLMEQRLLSLDREASSLGEQGRAALNIHGRKALDDRESELFGTDPMKQPLMVRMQDMNQPRVRRRVTRLLPQVVICKQCSRPIISSQFQAHLEFCVSPAQPQAQEGSEKGQGADSGFTSASAARVRKRQAVEARRALHFMRTRDIKAVTPSGTAPVAGLIDPQMLHRAFHFQLGERFARGNDRT